MQRQPTSLSHPFPRWGWLFAAGPAIWSLYFWMEARAVRMGCAVDVWPLIVWSSLALMTIAALVALVLFAVSGLFLHWRLERGVSRAWQLERHLEGVASLAAAFGRALRLEGEELDVLVRAAELHDIGKIAIPESILLKPGALTLEEFDIMQSHTTLGGKLLGGSDSDVFKLAEEIALYHHENFDGTGYTPGLAGEAIPMVARIVSIADVFDALTHERPYKRAWSWEEAVDWISEQAGQKFDPAAVEAFRETQAVRMPSDGR